MTDKQDSPDRWGAIEHLLDLLCTNQINDVECCDQIYDLFTKEIDKVNRESFDAGWEYAKKYDSRSATKEAHHENTGCDKG